MMTASVMMAALLLGASDVSIDFNGELKTAIQQIATQGELNVVVEGELTQHVQLHFSDYDAGEALEALCSRYNLELEKKGKLWFVRGSTTAPSPVGVKPAAVEPAVAPPPAGAVVLPPSGGAALHVESGNGLEAVGAGVVVPPSSHVENATSFGGPLIVDHDAVVDGDAVAFGSDVILHDRAVVKGDAVSLGGKVVRADSAIVRGEQVSIGGKGFWKALTPNGVAQGFKHETPHASEEHHDAGLSFAAYLSLFAVLFGVGFAAMMFAPNRTKYLTDTIRREPMKNAVVGVMGAMALLPVTIVLCVTGIGIPVAMALWVLLFFAFPPTFVLVANTVGAMIPLGKVRRTQALTLAIGCALTLTVLLLPVVGVMVWVGLGSVALGALIRTRGGQPPRGAPLPDMVPMDRLGV